MPNKLLFVLIALIVVFTTLAYGAVHQPVIAFFYFMIAVLPIFWAVDCLRSGSLRYNSSYIQLPIFCAAVYGVIQIIPFGMLPETGGVAGIPRTISFDPFSTQVNAAHLFALLIFFSSAVVAFDSASRLRKTAIFISVFGFAYAFFAILQSVLSPDKIYGIYERIGADPFGSFVSRNNFAAWIELAAALPLGLLFTGAVAKDKRLLYVTAIALMGIALLLSGSRGGFVAFLAEILFLLFLTLANRERGRLPLRIALAVGLVLAIVVGSVFVGGESSLSRLTEDKAVAGSNLSRTHIWEVTLKIIGDSMPLGVGLGAYGAAYSKFDANSGLERVEQAHNDYLQTLSDAGIVGAVIGIAFLFFLFRTGFRAVRTENKYRRGLAAGAFAGIFAALVHSIFDFPLHTTAISLLFLTLLAVLVASGSKYKDDIPNEDESKMLRRAKTRV